MIEDSLANDKVRVGPRNYCKAMTSLKELYRIYTTIAAKPGEPVALSAFKLSTQEIEKTFSAFDEDYHISRFFHFSHDSGETYEIDGETVTHIAIDPEITSIL